jgi:hypothetical protein
MGRTAYPKIMITREEKRLLVQSGVSESAARNWFFKISGPPPSMYDHIEDVTGRPIEISDEESAPARTVEQGPPPPGGYCWMGFEVWEVYGITRERTCELCEQAKRQKPECLRASLEAVA